MTGYPSRRFIGALLLLIGLAYWQPRAWAAATPMLDDLVKAWLASQNVTSWPVGAYKTCDPGTGDQICSWNTALLGSQPTTAQLNALAATVSAQQAAAANVAAALAAGIQITSTSTPALSGTYAIDATHQQLIAAEQFYILTKGTFTNGGTTKPWLDLSGVAHTFPSTAEFTAFAEAVAQYVDALMAGTTPAQPVTIP